jgi:FKBP-type peptidyl-prolyl cis-trans isomerase SlyD
MGSLAVVIRPNAYVTIDYVLTNDDGDVLDTSDGDGNEPIEYVHGYGMLVPGLEGALVGLTAGDAREILVPADAGYGDRDEELVMEVDKSDFPDPTRIEEGDEFVAETPDGDEVVMRVVEVRDDGVVVDANHPLAGMTLHYAVKVRAVRVATEEEIASAAAEFEDAEHEHGPGCSHDHEHDPLGGQLVSLKKKSELPN